MSRKVPCLCALLVLGFVGCLVCRSFGWYLDQQIPNPADTNYFWRTCPRARSRFLFHVEGRVYFVQAVITPKKCFAMYYASVTSNGLLAAVLVAQLLIDAPTCTCRSGHVEELLPE